LAAPRDPRRRAHAVVLRDAEAGLYADLFLVAAVATMLAIRAFLAATGYPSLGGRALHVAHVLWGGLALAAALVLVLVSLRPRAKRIAAVLGGAGFGFFIDELGKFLTRDNDYFYQPAIAIIYLLFVAFYLTVRRRLSHAALDPDENLANALAIGSELASADLDAEEKARALGFLARAAPDDPRVPLVRRFIDSLGTVEAPPPSWRRRLARWSARRLEALLAHPAFPGALSAVFVGQALAGIVFAALTARLLWTGWRTPVEGLHVDLGVAQLLRFASSLASGALVWAGVLRLVRSRVAAFRLFRLALHVSLFVTQVFVFYDAQLAGLLGLALNLVLLGGVQGLLARERRGHPEASG
jgi:hypothetical protein